MSYALQADLQFLPLQDVLSICSKRGLTGLVRVVGDGETVLWLGEGRLRFARSSEGEWSPEDLVIAAFLEIEGSVMVEQTSELPAGVDLVDLDLHPLVDKGLQRREEHLRILADPLSSPDTVLEMHEDSEGGDKVTLDRSQLRLLLRFDGSRTLGQVARETKREVGELADSIRPLFDAGVLTVVSSGAARDARPAEKAASTTARKPAASEPAASEPPAKAATPPSDHTVVALPQETAPQEADEVTVIGEPVAACLAIDDEEKTSFILLDDAYTIGRVAQHPISIPDKSVSSNHARIFRAGVGYAIEDIGSRNGTFVNGEKLEASRPLHDGDLVRIGAVQMTYIVSKPADVSADTVFEMPLPDQS